MEQCQIRGNGNDHPPDAASLHPGYFAIPPYARFVSSTSVETGQPTRRLPEFIEPTDLVFQLVSRH
jgi:hypothetical protein